MRILMSGSTGFVGSALVKSLQGQGHEIARLARPGTQRGSADSTGTQDIAWDPVSGQFGSAAAEGSDALIHLAGASIADGRWNASRKALLRTSRIDATRQLIAALAKLQRAPRVIVAASAIGYYGSRGDEILTESSAPGSDLLAGLCREWEAETARSSEFGARVVTLRFGIILAAHGGALAKMVMAIQTGLRRAAGRWAAVDVLGYSRGSRAYRAIRAGVLSTDGTGQRGLAKSGAKQRIHNHSRQGSSPPRYFPRARVRAPDGTRRNGRRFAPFQPKSSPIDADKFRLSIPAATPGSGALAEVFLQKLNFLRAILRFEKKSSGATELQRVFHSVLFHLAI